MGLLCAPLAGILVRNADGATVRSVRVIDGVEVEAFTVSGGLEFAHVVHFLE